MKQLNVLWEAGTIREDLVTTGMTKGTYNKGKQVEKMFGGLTSLSEGRVTYALKAIRGPDVWIAKIA